MGDGLIGVEEQRVWGYEFEERIVLAGGEMMLVRGGSLVVRYVQSFSRLWTVVCRKMVSMKAGCFVRTAGLG